MNARVNGAVVLLDEARIAEDGQAAREGTEAAELRGEDDRLDRKGRAVDRHERSLADDRIVRESQVIPGCGSLAPGAHLDYPGRGMRREIRFSSGPEARAHDASKVRMRRRR